MHLYDPVTHRNFQVEGQNLFNLISDYHWEICRKQGKNKFLKRSWFKSVLVDIRTTFLFDTPMGCFENIMRWPYIEENAPLTKQERKDFKISEEMLSDFIKQSKSPRIRVYT